MFAKKFLEAVAVPALQIAEGLGKTVERQFQREANAAAQRVIAQAERESSKRIVNFFSAIGRDEEPEPGAAASTGARITGGFLNALPPDDEY